MGEGLSSVAAAELGRGIELLLPKGLLLGDGKAMTSG